ncbi:MAG: hypothetical protein QG578_509, partial [Thermodesulfobacteriota bacterium]|nr:hypothetical protein [Thermodesulfobacteriota bacterium]
MNGSYPDIHSVKESVLEFVQRPDIKKALDFLLTRLPDEAELFIAGGAIRNLIMEKIHGWSPVTADIDLFIGGIDRGHVISEILSPEKTAKTALGGIRWYPEKSGLYFDLSLLTDFIAIKGFDLKPTLDNLLLYIDFNVNAIVFDLKKGHLYERNCISSIAGRVLDFNSVLIYDKFITVYRMLLFCEKLKFFLSERALNYTKMAVDIDLQISLEKD